MISFVEYEINLFSFGQIFEYFKAIKNWLWTNKKETDACCMFWIKHFLCQLSLVCCIKLLYSPLSISPEATILRGSNATTSLRPSLMKWTSVPNLNMKMMVRCGFQELCYVQQCSTVQLWSYGSTNNSNICHVFWCWRQTETVTCVLFNFCFRLQLNEHQHENGI